MTRLTRCRVVMFPALWIAVFLLVSVACGGAQQASTPEGARPSADQEMPRTTPGPEVHGHPNPKWAVAPSLEEQIFDALTYDRLVIVRASLLSVTATTEEEGAGYRPLHELRFTVHEYLEGSGPTELVVVVRGERTYPTEPLARREAEYAASQRNTSWDNRQATLFVGLAEASAQGTGGSGGTSRRAAFMRSNPEESPWDYTVDHMSRAWLPGEAAATGTDSVAANFRFITDGAKSPAPTITMADLRTQIAALKAEFDAGKGIFGFEECISRRILYERLTRAQNLGPRPKAKTIGSGLAAGTGIDIREDNHGEPQYNNYWLKGPDASFFQAVNVDDDTSPANGYTYMLATARPLLAGTYRVHYMPQHYTHVPCNFKPSVSYSDWTVTVTAPAGTVHEAFFDLLVGTTGFPLPPDFAISGVSTAIHLLDWNNGKVVLTLYPYANLAGHTLDFIGLDGTVILSLDAGAAVVDRTTGTLTWPVATQPWREEDQLMLRIRQSATRLAAPAAPTNPVATADDTEVDLSWDAVSGAAKYRVEYRLSTSSSWTTDDASVTGTSHTVDGLTCGTAYDFRVSAYGNGTTRKAAWGTAATVSGSTDACANRNRAPAFGASSYTFSVREDASTGDAVGSVSATDADAGDTVTYSITAGNADGKFAVNGSTGAITVAGALDYETTASYTLTAQAADGNGGTTTVSVAISVTDVVEPSVGPSITISGLVTTLGKGESDEFTVTATLGQDTTGIFLIALLTSGSGISLNSGCTSGDRTVILPIGVTSHTATFTLHGCAAPGGTITARLIHGTTIATTTQAVTVTA